MDNADLIQHRDAMRLVRRRILGVIAAFREQALKHRAVVCTGYTHLQPAQPTTVGKRIALWIQDLILDLETIDFRLNQPALPGRPRRHRHRGLLPHALRE